MSLSGLRHQDRNERASYCQADKKHKLHFDSESMLHACSGPSEGPALGISVRSHEQGSCTRPPPVEGENQPAWKVRVTGSSPLKSRHGLWQSEWWLKDMRDPAKNPERSPGGGALNVRSSLLGAGLTTCSAVLSFPLPDGGPKPKKEGKEGDGPPSIFGRKVTLYRAQ